MASWNPKKRNSLPLAYRLRPSVSYHPLPDGRQALVLLFPLKVVFIHDYWRPVLACLVSPEPVPLAHIALQVPQIFPERIAFFLNDLVRKGYCEQVGVPVLAENTYPSVCIIIPVRNRPQEIAACLQSLNDLNYPAEKLEVIVVDDASEDTTPQEAARFAQVLLIRLERHCQAAFCRNRAAESAKAEILAFIDSDCLADPLWLRELVPAFQDASLGAVGGRVDSYFDKNGLDRYEKVKSALKIGTWFKRSEPEERFFYVPACNFLVKRDVFLKLGGFRESLHVGEDVDFCWRLQDQGYVLEYRPLGVVFHKHRNSLWPFCARRFDYGTSEPMLQQLHPDRVKTLYLPLPESLFWVILAVSLLFKTALLSPICGSVLILDIFKKHAKLRARKIPVGFFQVSLAQLRGYLAFLYHCCSFVSRYYLAGAILAFPFFPAAAGLVCAMHLLAAMVQYGVKRPAIDPISFLVYFSLEQISYQSGVWWECLRRFNFKPVFPRIIHKRP